MVEKNGANIRPAFFSSLGALGARRFNPQSRSPESAISNCSRLTKMLNRLMYTPVVAMM